VVDASNEHPNTEERRIFDENPIYQNTDTPESGALKIKNRLEAQKQAFFNRQIAVNTAWLWAHRVKQVYLKVYLTLVCYYYSLSFSRLHAGLLLHMQ